MATPINRQTEMTLVQAVTDALRTKLTDDETTLVLGEDVGKNGGVFRATDGLQEEFGEDRIIDTPLSEAGIVGTSIGLAVNGFKPIVEIQFLGFIYPAYEQIMTHVSRVFLESMRSYRAFKEPVPSESYTIKIGKAKYVTEGQDVTLIAWGAMVQVAQKAATEAATRGISCEVIDLRTLYPLDRSTIAASVQKTGRAVIIHEAQATGGLGNDLIALINDTSFLYLRAPIARVTGFDVPVPLFALEDHYIPTPTRVLEAIQRTVDF
ncbi:alpha-ketoacid dehydrogenase subunit beta [Exiguobacterium antarcticum]|uniref:alpha-ketoacid dehydrogenase subunit beta n=1 Tax=Exiguobacterium antarcticum TaxID=132920 RepID=UPI000285E84E|nr:transketolase C-terminal domain-containing protein [Exiguobacterium antarcticum]AFS69521.1 Pyruvate dehydrogenase E1 component subunit beta [Exiguobacterium antarcticum B7]